MLICVDIETYYDDLYRMGDQKLTTLEYVTDRRFKAHMMGVRYDTQSTFVVPSDEIQATVDEWKKLQATGTKISLLAHNTMFDGLILSHHYGFVADFYYDTKSMSAGLWHHRSSSLKALAERLWPDDPTMRKGEELESTKGVPEFSPELYASIAGYCAQDVNLCWMAFNRLLDDFPVGELEIIDILTRMTVDAQFELDLDLIDRYIPHLEAERKEIIARSGLHVFAETYNLDKKERPQFVKEWGLELRKGRQKSEDRAYWLALKVLNSNNAFSAWCGHQRIAIPKKPNEKGVMIPAFGQQDIGYQQMTARHPQFKSVWEARKAAKSNINLSRAIRYRDTALAFSGKIPLPLKYSAAHTHRFGGAEKLNAQNMTRNASENHPLGDLRPGALRRALLAPKDQYVYVSDSSNIELRLSAYMSDNERLLNLFDNGGDPYLDTAMQIYNRMLTKKDNPTERGVGKATELGCFGAETLVLTNHGVRPIIAVRSTDKVWDGEEWASHKGLLPKGTQPVLTLSGVSVTPDHKILCGTRWKDAQSLAHDAATRSQALATGAANLPLPDTFAGSEAALQASSFGATATPPSTSSTRTTSRTSVPPDAVSAPTAQGDRNNTGPMPRPSLTTPTGHDCSTGSVQPSPAATTPTTRATSTTAPADSQCTPNGAAAAPASCATSRHLPDGTAPTSKWTASTTTEGTSPATFASSAAAATCATSGESPTSKLASLTSKPVYDLLNCGPRHRFTIITDDGPLLVHNCSYGMGRDRYKDYLNTGPLGMPPIFFKDEAMYGYIVNTYRRINYPQVDLWARADMWLYEMSKPDCHIDFKMLRIRYQKIILPSGLALEYPNLRAINGQWVFDSKGEGNAATTWGGTIVENVMQALTAEFIKSRMRDIHAYFKQFRGRVALQVHDEIVALGPREDAEEHMAEMNRLMRIVPDWAPGLPVDAEGDFASNYVK